MTLIVTDRPRTASISILAIFVTLLLAKLVTLLHSDETLQAKDLPQVLTVLAAVCGIFIIVTMPMRDPYLPSKGISPPFGPPTVKLRSPEDNLTPWQYMTVSWMAPLMAEGVKRQINDDDVWELAYEFKHERLHTAFRQLRGSVTKRLFVANGMDLIFTTTLGLIKMVASTLFPICS